MEKFKDACDDLLFVILFLILAAAAIWTRFDCRIKAEECSYVSKGWSATSLALE
ncbi:MAG: hypothetical protein ABSB81_06125 [Halobacteriota archaeon]|jgi:hypothetical protein